MNQRKIPKGNRYGVKSHVQKSVQRKLRVKGRIDARKPSETRDSAQDQSRTVDLQRGPTCQYHQIPTSQIVSVVWVLWYCWHGYVSRGYISFIDVTVTVKINGDYSLVSIIFSVLVIVFVAVTASCAVVVVARFCGLVSVVGIRSSIAASVTVRVMLWLKFLLVI